MLTDNMEKWAVLKKQLCEVEKEIVTEVLALRTSVAHKETHVKFVDGRKKVDYKTAVSQFTDDEDKKRSLISEHSKTSSSTTTKWKLVAEDLGISKSSLDDLTSTGRPNVVINYVPVSVE